MGKEDRARKGLWVCHQWNKGQTPRDSEGQGSLECWSSWGCRVRHDLVTEQQQLYIYHIT